MTTPYNTQYNTQHTPRIADEDNLIMKMMGEKYPKFANANMDALRNIVRAAFVDASRMKLRDSALKKRKMPLIVACVVVVLLSFWFVYVLRSNLEMFSALGNSSTAYGIMLFCVVLIVIAFMLARYWRKHVVGVTNDAYGKRAFNLADRLLIQLQADEDYSKMLHIFDDAQYAIFLRETIDKVKNTAS